MADPQTPTPAPATRKAAGLTKPKANKNNKRTATATSTVASKVTVTNTLMATTPTKTDDDLNTDNELLYNLGKKEDSAESSDFNSSEGKKPKKKRKKQEIKGTPDKEDKMKPAQAKREAADKKPSTKKPKTNNKNTRVDSDEEEEEVKKKPAPKSTTKKEDKGKSPKKQEANKLKDKSEDEEASEESDDEKEKVKKQDTQKSKKETPDVKKWLEELKIPSDKADEYTQKFAQPNFGYDSVAKLREYPPTEEDLENKIGVTIMVHRKAMIQALKAPQSSPPAGTSSELLKEVQQSLQQLQEEVAYLRLSRYESLSHIAVYNMIETRFGFTDDQQLLWQSIPLPDQAFVAYHWARFDAELLDGTEPTCQEVMQNLLATVLTSDHPLRSWATTEIPNPDKKPDISITKKKDASISWKTLLIPMEFEKVENVKEGIGQVISYMSTCLAESRRPSLLGVFSDGRTIDILRVHPQIGGHTTYAHTGLLPLFPDPKPSTFTTGFYSLIRLLSASLNDLNAISHPESIVVCGSTFQVDSYIADGCKSRVYKCINAENNQVVVKTLLGVGEDHLRTEAKMLRILASHNLNDHFPNLLTSDANSLVLSPCEPYSLRTYITQNGCNSMQAYSIMEQIVMALKVAHQNAKIIHNDLRPSNITISNTGKPRIIDWGLGVQIPQSQPNSFGTIAYAASKLLTWNNSVGSPATDLESATYVLLFLKQGRLPWHKAQTPKVVVDARKKIDDPDVMEILKIILTRNDYAHDAIIEYLRNAQGKH